MKLLIALLISLMSVCATAQDSLFLYEQQAADYFFDSLLTKEFSKNKTVFFSGRIDNKHAILDSPVGFSNYKSTRNPDTSRYYIVKSDQIEIEGMNLNEIRLRVKKMSGFEIYLYDKAENVNKERELFIEIRKRYTYRPDLFVVQLIVYSKEFKTNYFFEFNRNSKKVNQWYKTQWKF